MSFLSCKKQFVVESDVFKYKWKLKGSSKHSWKMGFFSSVKNQRKHSLNDPKKNDNARIHTLEIWKSLINS